MRGLVRYNAFDMLYFYSSGILNYDNYKFVVSLNLYLFDIAILSIFVSIDFNAILYTNSTSYSIPSVHFPRIRQSFPVLHFRNPTFFRILIYPRTPRFSTFRATRITMFRYRVPRTRSGIIGGRFSARILLYIYIDGMSCVYPWPRRPSQGLVRKL